MLHGTPAREDESTVIPLRGRLVPEIPVAAVDPNDLNSPHTLAVLSIAPGSTVLDVGCGPGVVARALAARGCKVWGVEIDAARASSARTHCVEVLEADVEAVSLSEEFAGRSFDVVLFLDVLEHLRNPQAVLAGAEAVLAPGGSVLLSVPNVTHGALRLELLSGKFRYRASGLLDRGHLRFFDAEGLDALIRQAGFRAETRLRVIRRLDQTEFDVDLASLPGELRTTLENDPDALTYQFFVIARPARGPQLVNDSVTLLERQQARIGELAAAIEQGAAYARHLQEELHARDARLHEIEGSVTNADQARYRELAAAIEEGAVYARRLHEELDARDARVRELEGARTTAERARFDELVEAIEKGGAYALHLREDLARATARQAELHAELTSAERERDAKSARLAEVEAAFAELERDRDATAARLGEAEDTVRRLEDVRESNEARAAGIERAFADLTRISEDTEAYVRHLEGELRKRTGDIAVRDDEMRVLRSHIEKTERTIGDRDRDIADRDAALQELRARVVEAERAIADQSALRNRIDLADRRIAELEPQLLGAERSAAENRAVADRLLTLLQQPRHRLAENGNNWLKRWTPAIHRLLRPLFASATRNRPWP